MNTEIKKIQDKAGEIYDKMQRIYDDAKEEKREVTSEEEARFDALNVEHNATLKKIEQLEVLDKKKHDKIENVEELAERTNRDVEEVKEDKRMADQVLRSYLIRGVNGLTQEEREYMTRAQSTTTNSEGGYTVDETMGNKIIETMKNFGGMRSVCDIQTTSKGEQINWPTNNDTTNVGRWLAENAAATNTDLVFGTTAINAWTASSDYIPVSAQLIQDSSFDIAQFIVNALSRRLGRLSNTGYTVGDGSSKPTGIVETSTLGKAAAAITATTFNEMLDLKFSVDRDYRTNGTWMFNDNTLLSLKKIALASTNQSLWQPGVVGGSPATIDGDAYTVNNDMPDMAAGTHPIIYGDMKQYLIRDAQGINIRRSEHVNFLKNQITFLGELRTDGKLLDTAAVKHMRMSNT
jgi:HK97 family phage major capsid protein